MNAGIPQTVNGHRYIGSAVDFRKRKNSHLSQLVSGKHHSRYLQNAFNKYGKSVFVFSVLEYCDKPFLVDREQNYLDIYRPEYNVAKIAGSALGVRHTPETRAKVSAAKMGHTFTAEARAKISAARKGTRPTEEARAKMSAALMGNKHTLGKKLTAEHRAKISAAGKGRKFSPEHRAKIGAASKRQICTSETRVKIGMASRGRIHTPETRAKMSASQRLNALKKKLLTEFEELRKAENDNPQPA